MNTSHESCSDMQHESPGQRSASASVVATGDVSEPAYAKYLRAEFGPDYVDPIDAAIEREQMRIAHLPLGVDRSERAKSVERPVLYSAAGIPVSPSCSVKGYPLAEILRRDDLSS